MKAFICCVHIEFKVGEAAGREDLQQCCIVFLFLVEAV